MSKNKISKSKFAEAIDPRFTGIFKNNTSQDLKDASSSKSESVTPNEGTSDKNQGFRDFVAKNLYEYLESNTKEVEYPVEKYNLFEYHVDDICLLPGVEFPSNSDIPKEELVAPPKKKRKKERKAEKESFKEVAVTADWLQRQAQLYNS